MENSIIRSIRWMSAIVTLFVLILLVQEFLSPYYDWDLDHEMYFAQRMLEGHLFWGEHEFHEKLPAMPILFLLPAWLESIFPFRVMSLVTVLIAAWALARLVPAILRRADAQESSDRMLNHFAGFGALLYVLIILCLPGSISTVNPMIGAMEILSCLLAAYIYVRRDLSAAAFLGMAVVVAFLAAFAISIRPYLLPASFTALVMAILWQSRGTPAGARLWHFLRHGILWIVLIGAWGGIINALPYVLAGRTDLFLEALSYLGAEMNLANPVMNVINSTILSAPYWFWISLAAMILWAGIEVVRAPRALSLFMLFPAVMILGVLAFMLTKHYWGHYVQLFVGPYAVLLILSFCNGLKYHEDQLPGAFSLRGAFFLIVPWAFLGAAGADINRMTLNYYYGRTHANDYWMEPIIEQETQGVEKASFLVPASMRLHWIYNEPRHGFPHAANSNHVAFGWWEKLEPSDWFTIPRTPEEYCQKLFDDGPTYIFDTPKGHWVDCLQTPASPYKLKVEETGENGRKLLVFRR